MSSEPLPSPSTSWKLSPKALFRNFFTSTGGEGSQEADDASSSGPSGSTGASTLPGSASASSSLNGIIVSNAVGPSRSGSTQSLEASEGGPSQKEASEETPKLGRKKQIREKRVLPARMRRVSSLLAGSDHDVDLLADSEPVQQQRILPDTTVFILASDPTQFKDVFEASEGDAGVDGSGFSANPSVVTACKEKAMIETPDFQLRDDSVQMGKTRGGAVKSEEDTSDAAYERRHRKMDNLEKKQRRLEKERLIRDRAKLKERIEQLKTADPRMLVPIFAARESHRASTPGASSLRGAEATLGLGKQNLSAEANATLQKIENLRKELVAEASDTLLRYDALLAEAPPASIQQKKRKLEAEDVDVPSPSPRGRQAARHSALAGQDVTPRTPHTPASSRMPASDSSPAEPRGRRRRSSALRQSDEVGSGQMSVVAEHQHHNIHARTSGGRFAPKSALANASPVAATKGRGKGASASAPDGSPAQARKPRPLRPCEIARKAAKEAARAASSSSQTTPSRGRSARSSSAAYVSAYEQQRRANKIGPSLAELTAAERRPKRVKLILGARPATTEGDSQARAEESEEVPADSMGFFPSGLSLEEAQAMLDSAVGAADPTADIKVESPGPSTGMLAAIPPSTESMTHASGSAQPMSISQGNASNANDGAASQGSVASTDKADAHSPSMIKQEGEEKSLGVTDPPTPSPSPASQSSAPTGAYMPGRSAAARARAAANIPARRSSGRVKELSTGAFGEKVPARALVREDFEKSMIEAQRSWESARVSQTQASELDSSPQSPHPQSSAEALTGGSGSLPEEPPVGANADISGTVAIKREETDELEQPREQ